MACAITTQWGNHVYWTPPDRDDISHYLLHRRTDEIAPINTADVIAHVPFTLGSASSPHFFDPFTAVNTSVAYTYWSQSVAWDGQVSLLSNKITATSSPSAIQTALTDIFAATFEPTGFVNHTDSVISFNTGTLTFSISPTATSFDYYIKGEQFTKTAADTVVIDNSTGITVIYYDSATLSEIKDPTDGWISCAIRTLPLVSIIYYSTADASAIYFGEERHGLTMDGVTHAYLHFVNGLAYASGLGLSNITADQSGDLDPHAQFGVAAGSVSDEDIYLPIDTVGSTVGLPIWYREGASGDWRKTTNVGFSVVTASAGTRLVYNQLNLGSWQLTQVTNDDFVLCHVFASTEINNPVFAIMGQDEYATLALARTGAETEINSLLLGDLPLPEIRPIATVVFQTNNGYANDAGARIRTLVDGSTYIDWRTTTLGRGVAATDHGALSGLGDDDHQQYLILSGRGGQTVDDTLVICGATTINDDLVVTGSLTVTDTAIFSYVNTTAAVSIQTTLHVSGAVTFGSSLNISGAVSISNTLWVCGATTLNGLTVSGTATIGTIEVTANLSVSGTLHASGASTFGSTVTISGVTTINNYIDMPEIAAPGNPAGDTGRLYVKDDGGGTTGLYFKDNAGAETDLLAGGGAGNAVYVEIEESAAVDSNAADMYLVFDTAGFTVSVNGQCATISAIPVAGGSSSADSISIGTPTDTSWADGTLAWSTSTTVADALDDINETLSYLAPDDASSLSGALDECGTTTYYTGRLSAGPGQNYKAGQTAGDTITYVIRDASLILYQPSPTTMFNKADEGTTNWYIAVGSASYGTPSNTIVHSASFNEASRTGSQSANWSSGALTVNYVAMYNSFPKWQLGRAIITLTSSLLSQGYNRVKLTRECGFATQSTNDMELWFDTVGSTPTLGTASVSANAAVIKYLSGVAFYDRGTTWHVSLSSANLCFNNTYNDSYIFGISSTSSLLGSAATIDYNGAGVTGASTPPAINDTLRISNLATTTPNANNRSTNAILRITAYNAFGDTDTVDTPSSNIMVDSYTPTSTTLYEYFDDESYRIPTTADFDCATFTITGLWTSTSVLTDGNAQIHSGGLYYPTVNWKVGYLPAQCADYSTGFTGGQTYYRAISNTASPYSNGIIELANITSANIVAVSAAGAVHVEIQLPGETGWLDLGKPYNEPFTATDGEGCRTSQAGNQWSWSVGAYSTVNSNYRYYLKITIYTSGVSLTQARELGW